MQQMAHQLAAAANTPAGQAALLQVAGGGGPGAMAAVSGVNVSIYLSIYLYMYIDLSIYLSICRSIYLSIYRSIDRSIYIYIYILGVAGGSAL